ncbi:alpha-1,6-mannosyl-glycoprotein 2-beta-N-acetylglucosaminyltransferase isoform X1 [Bactrocera oleae]|uniref:alpha-1,6-mannosyl-glycoprotein 2-beta-N-acetylglucosaminyltransferase isoform X1 n=1 Tax=Bactrocera oleae TaxID=104688 RepID=UPI001748BAF5|nr:alpha-1,6-mannosyl-glycoprotein 2-beta-N-acetylglucosaminyltransferase isoform X1 [Bactrocera oleae]XP_036234324.1 alpha-1,6-mannosyl-glycoprotein 2-beta-N-acetylglucosaminyltransferase isoform X1 [Bactrocera oleae]XP_036234325.1 alpha-1,6-mannosyl-glycoprotein 2-beta-N-acetylglucosaminyltransferase isoform X1 [Bactrocera oleae]XP_036234326.1 alpha-1,6-mannosyl-glycoprotein 2-beta-N-acetylglucosaminyltransferase isoform X1 [Bactrocera oleae]
MRVRKIPLPLPNTGLMHRKRNTYYIRVIIGVALIVFVLMQLHVFNYTDSREMSMTGELTNDSIDAMLSMVPSVLHKFLTPKSRNQTAAAHMQHNSTSGSRYNGSYTDYYHPPNISEIKQQIAKYNELQIVLNEDTYGPLQNDSVIIVVQVHTRITYLRHLIVSLAQAKDISKTLLIFSHDYYDDDINDLVQTIDFCKVIQIFYPYSIQTHPNEFPGVDPNDCPRDMKKDHNIITFFINRAIIRKCNNALYPDLYGHYREAKFTQTKHHWWWKANRVFDQLDVTRYHTGLVLFLEEDHYVAEDFLYLLEMMQSSVGSLCPQCDILSLGTYLKTFNYYTYNSKTNKKSPSSQYASSLLTSSNLLGYNRNKNRNSLQMSSHASSSSSSTSAANSFNKKYFNENNKNKVYVGDTVTNTNAQITNNHNTITTSTTTTTDKSAAQQSWSYHVLPSLYSIYQKVEVMPWISSKHNMGFAFNRSTWSTIRKCAQHFCFYDDYNWDWSLHYVSQQCLQKKLHAMIVKGPRVFHIGECGVHHKKKNCESNQVIAKVQQVLRIARKSKQLFPRSLSLTAASLVKKTKLRKGNGGWGDRRDHQLCMNMTKSMHES